MIFLIFPGIIFLSLPICISLFSYWNYFLDQHLNLVTSALIALSIFVVLFEIISFKFSRLSADDLFRPLTINLGTGPRLKFLVGFFAVFVFFFGIMDLFVHGVVIMGDRSKYYLFNDSQARIRHISSLVWIFVPFAMSGLFKRWWSSLLMIWAFVFPIVVLDRNRLMMSAFSVVVLYLLFDFKRRFRVKFAVCFATAVLSILVFSKLGSVRSGDDGILKTYSDSRDVQASAMGIIQDESCKLPQYFPVSDDLKLLSPKQQWFAIYTGSPILNLTTQEKCLKRDTSILKAQTIPLWKRSNTVGRPALISPRLTAGTEAMPFYLGFGWIGIVASALIEFFLIRYVSKELSVKKDIFLMVIFLRFAYCALFFAFDPQFYLWTTLGLVLLMLISRFAVFHLRFLARHNGSQK